MDSKRDPMPPSKPPRQGLPPQIILLVVFLACVVSNLVLWQTGLFKSLGPNITTIMIASDALVFGVVAVVLIKRSNDRSQR